MVLINNCDSISGWEFWTGSIGLVDNVDFVEGVGCIRVETDPAVPQTDINAEVFVGQDLTNMSSIRFNLQVDVIDTFLLYAETPTGIFAVSLEPYIGGIAEAWLQIEIPKSAFEIYTGTPNWSMINRLRYRHWVWSTIRGFKVDNIETVEAPALTHILNISASIGGTTNPASGSHVYDEGVTASVVATPSSGYVFDYWELDGVNMGANLSINVLMDADHSLYAVFREEVTPPPTHLLSITTNPISGVPFTLTKGGIQTSYQTPYSERRDEDVYDVEFPPNVIFGEDTWNFVEWENHTTNPKRTINLTSDMSISPTYELVIPPPAKGNIQVHAFLNGNEVTADGLIVETSQTFQTPTVPPITVDPGTYTVEVTLEGYAPYSVSVTVEEGQTIRVDAQFATPQSPIEKIKAWWGNRTPQEKVIVISGVPLSISTVYALIKLRGR